MQALKESNTARIALELAEDLSADSPEEFLILAITAGPGNGWNFTPEVLRRSLPLWNGVECFVDHAGRENQSPNRSVRDLGGVCSAPRWDEQSQGVLLKSGADWPGRGSHPSHR